MAPTNSAISTSGGATRSVELILGATEKHRQPSVGGVSSGPNSNPGVSEACRSQQDVTSSSTAGWKQQASPPKTADLITQQAAGAATTCAIATKATDVMIERREARNAIRKPTRGVMRHRRSRTVSEPFYAHMGCSVGGKNGKLLLACVLRNSALPRGEGGAGGAAGFDAIRRFGRKILRLEQAP